MKLHIDAVVKEKAVQGIGRTSKKAYATQSVWVDLGKAFPSEVRTLVDAGTDGVPSGRYVIDESALYVDKNGDLRISMRSMKAVPAAAQVKSA